MSETDAPEKSPAADPRRARRRRWGGHALNILTILLVVPVVAVCALWLRLANGPLTLPSHIRAEVSDALDQAMPLNQVEIGEVILALPDGVTTPEIRLRDVRVADNDGAPRAAFPEVAVRLSGHALLQRQIRPVEVDVAGAGLRLSRDAEGRLDLALTGSDRAAPAGVEETLGRIDAMFASPELAGLSVVSGSDLQLDLTDDVTGEVMRVRGAQMRLQQRDGSLTLTVGGALEGERAATVDISITRSAEAGETSLGVTFENLGARDLATAAPALGWLDLMRAPISGYLGGRLSDDGTIGDVQAALEIGAGQLSIQGADAPLNFDMISVGMLYEANEGRARFDRVVLDAPDLSFVAEGHADITPDGRIYTGQFRLSEITADPLEFFEAPLELDGAALDMRLTLWPDLTLEIGQAVIFADNLEARARGRIVSREAGFDIALDASLPSAQADTILGYWPVDAVPRTRRWLAENLQGGTLNGVDFALRGAAGDPAEMALTFDFADVTLRALRHLPPIEGGVGYLSLTGSRLIMQLDEGAITAPGGGDVSLGGSTMVVDDVRVRGPDAVFDLAAEGGLTDVLRLLSERPVSLFRQGNLTAERLGEGRAELTGQINARLIRQEGIGDTRFDVSGTIFDYSADALVPNRSLRADRLLIEAQNESVQISGQASFDGVPVTGEWSRALGEGSDPTGRVEARAVVDREILAGLGVTLPAWMISGRGAADLTLVLPQGEPGTLTIGSDLQGIGLSLPFLGWRIGQGTTGTLSAEIQLGPEPSVSALAMDAGGLNLEGRVSLREGGGLQALTADRFRLGGWLDVRGVLQGRGAGRAPAVTIQGGSVDLRNVPQLNGGGGAGGATGGPISVFLDRLQLSRGIALTGLNADLRSDGGLSGQFQGQVNGGATLSGTLINTQAGPAVRIRAPDGGAVLRSAGVFQTAYGGAMELVLQSTGAEGTFDGTLSIDGPRLRNAPAMAELLNLISVVGLLEQLGGEGINLGDVDARFRLTPDRLIVQEGTAVGPSLGLSIDGIYALESGALDMQGVVSPLYIVNGLIGAIFAPRREGLFGFSYRLTGTAQNTQVTVNPLSILTPGVFREIFRRPPPDLSESQ